MTPSNNIIQDYIQALQRELATGHTTEHTHRPALKTFIDSFAPGLNATNEPGRFLKNDFPRLPLTSNKELFSILVGNGVELVALHLLQAHILNTPITKYLVSGANVVERVEYKEPEKRVYINKDQYFEGIEPDVWNFHIGGYQVCEKWLKDRRGRTLTYDELTHYQKIIVALSETIRIMGEIDQSIASWPIE